MVTESGRKPDVSIAGSGKVAGGAYGRVRIAGAGSVDGDLEADEVRVMGSGSLKGSVKAEEFSTSGACSVEADVEAGVFKTSGAFKVEGGVTARSVTSSGAHKVGGRVKAEVVTVAGSWNVGGDVEAERCEIGGSFRVSGLINADQIDVELNGGRSSAREIGGSKITVRLGSSFLRWWRIGGHLKVRSIEGDEIYLEATEADTVRGKRVELGPGCRIGTVEYEETLEVSPEATVKDRVKTGDGE